MAQGMGLAGWQALCGGSTWVGMLGWGGGQQGHTGNK